MFDIKKSKINKGPSIKAFSHIFTILKFLSFLGLLLSLFNYISINAPLFFLSLFLLFSNINSFLSDYIRETKEIEYNIEKANLNLADFLTITSFSRVKKAIDFADKKGVQLNSSILLYFLLTHKNKKIDFIFNRLLLDKKEIIKELKKTMLVSKDYDESTGTTHNLDSIMLESAKACIRRKGKNIKTNDILSALSKIEPVLKEHLRVNKLKKEDIDNLNFWQENLFEKIKNTKKWWSKENLSKIGSIATDWSFGFTPTLDKYSTDLTSLIQQTGFVETIGHKNERAQAERVLIRGNENNVLLVGDSGIGRLSIVRAIVQRCFLKQSFEELNKKRFIELNMQALLAEATSIDEVESILDTCFKEASLAGNIIIVLSDFDNYINEQSVAGKTDISALIVPYLRNPEFKFIGITSFSGLHKYIEFKPQILSLFEKIEVSEATEKETILILQREIPAIEHKYNLFITYPAIIRIIELSKKYIQDNPFPKKAIVLLNDVAVYVSSYLKEKVMLVEHVEKIMSEKTEIPIGKLSIDEREVLLNLENLIHKRIINQNEAVLEISASLRRARTGIKSKTGPMGTFLFLGPTGVGKTETAKALAESYFGSETKMIRFDMSEFQTSEDIKRFIGEKNNPGLLALKVRKNPFSLILFDEIEKSHPNILNLLLQILDEGFITDSLQRKIDFTNTIIISTSNAGYKIILKAFKEKKELHLIKQELLDYIFNKAIFRPELINRFDAFVLFQSLSKENLVKIAELRFKKLQKNLSRKQITLNVSNKAKMRIVELSYNPQFGAREMRRVIQDKIENELARSFLANEIKEGDTILIDDDFKINVIKS